MQIPLPNPDSLRIQLPLPSVLEEWRDLYLRSVAEKVIVFILIAAALYFLARYARRLIGEHIEGVGRRHTLRKSVSYGYAVLLLLVAIALFADWLSGLGTILALLIAGIAVGLQDVLRSVVGWVYLSSRSGVEIGSRIEVDGLVGDVIDIGVLKTTMSEVGGQLVHGRQSTGRLVTIPNQRMISSSILISPSTSPFIWNEIRLEVTYTSDWRRVEEILKEVGVEMHAHVAEDVQRSFQALERRYAFRSGASTPIVYVSLGPSGVELTLRFMVHVRRQRDSLDHASRLLLEALGQEQNVRMAFLARRTYNEDSRPGTPAG